MAENLRKSRGIYVTPLVPSTAHPPSTGETRRPVARPRTQAAEAPAGAASGTVLETPPHEGLAQDDADAPTRPGRPAARKSPPGADARPYAGQSGAHTQKITDAERQQLEGRFHRATAIPAAPVEMTPEQQEMAARLEAIGYLDGSRLATASKEVVKHDPARTQPGYNFYTSGHGPEAHLIDNHGALVHSWRFPYADTVPAGQSVITTRGTENWRRAWLYPNGDVLAIFEGQAIIKVDKDSKLLWAKHNRAHHDLQVLENGHIATLTRRAGILKDINPDQPILEDFIAILDADGNTLKEISLVRALLNSEFKHLWPEGRMRRGDVFHTNTIEILDGRIAEKVPAFRKGNALVSLLRLGVIGVVDLDTASFVWAHRGEYRAQHDPKVLANGNLLLFDNKGRPNASTIYEFDPVTMQVVWKYQGSPETPFYSATCGSAERLPNGNTLICESDGGRAFEVTPERETVWEFYNPHRAGKENEYIATLYDLVRIPPDFPLGWAHFPPGPAAIAAEAPAP
jgi:hypothetical protein